MTTIYLVRHAEPSGSWHNSRDPGLTVTGREQAEAVALRLAAFGELQLFSSPLQRTRQTAAPYARNRGLTAILEPGVAEIPAPTDHFAERSAWLQKVLGAHYSALPETLAHWRDRVLSVLAGVTGDTVFFTHYIAINAAVGAALGNDRVVNFSPAHASLTRLRVQAGKLRLLEFGHEASGLIL